MRRIGPLSLSLLALAGCAGPCDPNAAGFASGIGCELGGGYDRNEQMLNQSLGNARQDLATQRARASAAAADAAQAQNNLAIMRGRLRRLANDNSELQHRIDVARRRVGADQAQIARLQAEKDAQDGAIARQSQQPNAADVEALERRRRQLLDAVSAM